MNQDTLQLFKILTELQGAPGFEHRIRTFMKSELEKYTDEIIQDRLGSIFGVKRGKDTGPKVMVAGHMDEVGFMVTSISEKGLVNIQPLGGWWSQVLLAQRMQIMTDRGPVIGVIGSIPPHLLDDSKRNKPMEIKNMFLDIGADDRDDAINIGIKPGQQIVPICPFTPMANPKKILAKAWDNRYGCGLAIELLKELKDESLPNTLYSGATVQEEVGLRGAQTAANMIQPDIFYALDDFGKKLSVGIIILSALILLKDQGMNTQKIRTILYNQLIIPFFVIPILILVYSFASLNSRFFNMAKFVSFSIFGTLIVWGFFFLVFRLTSSGTVIPEISMLLTMFIWVIFSIYFYNKKINS